MNIQQIFQKMKMYNRVSIILIVLNLSSFTLFSQTISNKNNVFVDENGIMRWENTKAEVKGFGVNYSVPFAHAFRIAKKLGVNPKKLLITTFIILQDWVSIYIVCMFGILKLAM